ncbi:MAG TPA: aminoacyl-tRNA hydrolase [Oscillospiraceae bacterium]|nr:aminoacyl-tRNA hydrolase [Oscillospiraceae bacterium]
MGFFSRKPAGGASWLVVCLGNPGARYERTRHNVGFLVADRLAARSGIPVRRLRFKALTAEMTLGGARALVIKPQTFMNLSGEAVRDAAAFYHIPPERILVVADDVSLPAGKLRIRRSGSAGGHNGLKSIIYQLSSDQFPRVKIGVGAPPHPEYQMVDWVLGTPAGAEKEAVDAAIVRAADAVECIIRYGDEKAMNEYN